MQQFTFVVKDRDGVHARPAGAILKAAGAFKSDITLESSGRKISLKGGIFALMAMGIRCGSSITVTCSGADEEQAAAALLKAFEEYLG